MQLCHQVLILPNWLYGSSRFACVRRGTAYAIELVSNYCHLQPSVYDQFQIVADLAFGSDVFLRIPKNEF